MLLLGHRGATGAGHPENTLAAVERALDHGADGVEVDVRVTRDGRLVCLHDASLRRTAGISRDAADLTASELAAVRLPGGHPLPMLADVVRAVRGRGRLVVEMKTPRWPLARRMSTAAALAGDLRSLGVTRDAEVVVSSFDRHALGLVRRHAPVRTALLTGPGVPVGTALRLALHGGHDEAHPHVRALLFARASLIADAHAVGLAVTAWTADRPADLRALAERGADAAICDDPAAARAVLTATTNGATR